MTVRERRFLYFRTAKAPNFRRTFVAPYTERAWRIDVKALLVSIGLEKDFELREIVRARGIAGGA